MINVYKSAGVYICIFMKYLYAYIINIPNIQTNIYTKFARIANTSNTTELK